MATRTEKYTDILSQMIRYNTVSFSDQKDKTCFYDFQKKIRTLFPNVFSVCEFEDFNASILLRWKGKDSSKRVLFMNHQDVVEPVGEWKVKPFSGEVKENKLWGRGCLDDKGGLFGMLQAADELIAEGFVPSCDIYFESSCDEESDSLGCLSIAEKLKERNLRFDWVLDEGGMIVNEPIPGAKGRFAVVGLSEKGCVELKIIAKSKGGHASMPPKNSPLVRLGKFMAYCDSHNIFDVYLSPVIQKMFKDLSKSMSGAMKLLLGHPKLFKGLLESVMPKVSATAGALLSTTLAFTRANGSCANNVLPDEAWVMGNMRTSLHQGIAKSIETVKKVAAGFDLEVEVLDPGFESNMASVDCIGYKLIEEGVAKAFPDVAGTVPYVQTSASDSRFMSLVSDNCYRFVPFVIDDQQLASIHSVNECVDIKTLEPAVDFYRYVMEHC